MKRLFNLLHVYVFEKVSQHTIFLLGNLGRQVLFCSSILQVEILVPRNYCFDGHKNLSLTIFTFISGRHIYIGTSNAVACKGVNESHSGSFILSATKILQ